MLKERNLKWDLICKNRWNLKGLKGKILDNVWPSQNQILEVGSYFVCYVSRLRRKKNRNREADRTRDKLNTRQRKRSRHWERERDTDQGERPT